MAKKSEYGYVYIFTNESFREGWVKIGKTHNIKQRLSQLDNTSCPLPFDVYAYLKTKRYDDAELFVHDYISHFNQSLRIRPNREYFKVSPKEALEILIRVKNLMNEADSELVVNDETGQKLVKKLAKKQPQHENAIEDSFEDSRSAVNSSNEEQQVQDFQPRLSTLKTLSSYRRYLKSQMTRDVMDKMGLGADLSEVKDIVTLKALREEIKKEEKLNAIHHTHSCALSQYINYIEAGFTWDDFEHDAILVQKSKISKIPQEKKSETKPKANQSDSKMRPPFQFDMVGLVKGDTIIFNPTSVEVAVVDNKNISYKGKTYTLSGFCKKFMPEKMRITSDAYQGPKFFSHQGKTLWKIRLEKENEIEL